MVATPPTLVAEYESSWTTTTTPKTVTPTIAANDRLVIVGMSANDTTQVNTPTDNLGTSLTYTLRQTIQNVNDFCFLRLWTAEVTGGQSGSFTLTATRAGVADPWGFTCLRFSGVSAFGATSQNNGEDGAGSQANLTTTQENSAIVCFAADWNATDGSTRTWRTVNSITPTAGNGFEKTYASNPASYEVYGAYYPDAGAAGVKTCGVIVPGAQRFSIATMELKGVLAGGVSGFGVGFFDGI
jgi:hypothetical protein